MHKTMNRNLPDPNSYLMMLESVAPDHIVATKVMILKGWLRRRNDRAEKDALEIWKKLIRNLPLETIEALERLMKRRLDDFYVAKSGLMVDKTGKKVPRKKFTCPECHKLTDGHKKHGDCDMVMGRRGWRRLGEYDG